MIGIQRYPTALLETLGAKSGGSTPIATDELLQLSLDASEFYVQSLSQVDTAVIAVNAQGFSGSAALQVPTGEVWRVRSVTAYTAAALGAGQTLDLQPAMQDGNAVARVICGTTSDTGGVGVSVSVGWDLRTPRLFPPGWRAGCFVRNVVAGPVNVTIVLDYDRLR
jgi:hypothetical protein